MQSKHFIFIGAAALCTALGAAETDSITTRNGTTYTNAVIQRADPDGVVIEYAPQPGSVGIAKLKFANPPEELRKRYNYTASDALIFEQNQAAGTARRQEEIAQGETEKERRHDKLVQHRTEEEAALEAKRQEAAMLAAAQMEMGGWSGGHSGDGDWYGTSRKRYRSTSRGPLTSPGPGARVNSSGFRTGLGLGWGDSGHWAQLPSQATRETSQSGAFRSPATRGNQPGRNLSAKPR